MWVGLLALGLRANLDTLLEQTGHGLLSFLTLSFFNYGGGREGAFERPASQSASQPGSQAASQYIAKPSLNPPPGVQKSRPGKENPQIWVL